MVPDLFVMSSPHRASWVIHLRVSLRYFGGSGTYNLPKGALSAGNAVITPYGYISSGNNLTQVTLHHASNNQACLSSQDFIFFSTCVHDRKQSDFFPSSDENPDL